MPTSWFSKGMKRNRGAERIDQPHAEQIQRDRHGEGHEGRCCGGPKQKYAPSERDRNTDRADGTLTPAMSQARREEPSREHDENCGREVPPKLKSGKAQPVHQDGGRRGEKSIKAADYKAHRNGRKEKARIDGQAAEDPDATAQAVKDALLSAG